jgi:hypothetical protein
VRFDRRDRQGRATDPKPFRFGLQALFVIVTAICVWLAVATWQPLFAVGGIGVAGAFVWHRGQLRRSTLQMTLGALLVGLAVLGGPMILALLVRL